MNGLISGIFFFNSDPRTQKTKVYFSRKQNQAVLYHLTLMIGFTVQTVEVHNHHVLSLDKKIGFNIQIDNKMNKCNKIGIIKQS